MAYRACGPVVMESAEGARPVTIAWRFARPLPARLFRALSVLRGVQATVAAYAACRAGVLKTFFILQARYGGAGRRHGPANQCRAVDGRSRQP